MNILEKIILHKKKEVAIRSLHTPFKELERSLFFHREIIPLRDYILNPSRTGIIAEFKRKSPSRGIINNLAEPEKIVSGYSLIGASAVSVLTDLEFFGGSNTDLLRARTSCNIPILRKDFIIDEYQIIETRAIGADAILLIAAALNKNTVYTLARFAQSLGLQVLLEIHHYSEIDMINGFINVVGVNNRNLNTFEVNTDISVEMAGRLPADIVRISESGLSSPEVIKNLRHAGYHGFLMGETFMKTDDPVAAFSDFVKLIN